MINDVARAFFEAPAVRQVCVGLPDEDLTSSDRTADRVGHLKMSCYGTRDAAMNWQGEVARVILKWGFTRGKYNPCLYWHKGWKVRVLVHGDDFVAVGEEEDVEWFRKLAVGWFEMKVRGKLGDGVKDEKEIGGGASIAHNPKN